ncbi:MAG TPA: hypothetical protein DCW42_05200, partial [Bacteroidetes bacterium]|nr:hypothetical protein [Bacteroidota bacterium]
NCFHLNNSYILFIKNGFMGYMPSIPNLFQKTNCSEKFHKITITILANIFPSSFISLLILLSIFLYCL